MVKNKVNENKNLCFDSLVCFNRSENFKITKKKPSPK